MQLALLRDFLYCCFGNLICAIIGLSNPIHQKKKKKKKRKKSQLIVLRATFKIHLGTQQLPRLSGADTAFK